VVSAAPTMAIDSALDVQEQTKHKTPTPCRRENE
jgi:hypothetical protein